MAINTAGQSCVCTWQYLDGTSGDGRRPGLLDSEARTRSGTARWSGCFRLTVMQTPAQKNYSNYGETGNPWACAETIYNRSMVHIKSDSVRFYADMAIGKPWHPELQMAGKLVCPSKIWQTELLCGVVPSPFHISQKLCVKIRGMIAIDQHVDVCCIRLDDCSWQWKVPLYSEWEVT